jgi:hypothetical protein
MPAHGFTGKPQNDSFRTASMGNHMGMSDSVELPTTATWIIPQSSASNPMHQDCPKGELP